MNSHTWYERANRVIEMDNLARELLDDEELWETWLMYGVADGDIDEHTTWGDVDEYYISDGNYEELCSLFKNLMALQVKADEEVF